MCRIIQNQLTLTCQNPFKLTHQKTMMKGWLLIKSSRRRKIFRTSIAVSQKHFCQDLHIVLQIVAEVQLVDINKLCLIPSMHGTGDFHTVLATDRSSNLSTVVFQHMSQNFLVFARLFHVLKSVTMCCSIQANTRRQHIVMCRPKFVDFLIERIKIVFSFMNAAFSKCNSSIFWGNSFSSVFPFSIKVEVSLTTFFLLLQLHAQLHPPRHCDRTLQHHSSLRPSTLQLLQPCHSVVFALTQQSSYLCSRSN